MNKKQKNRKLVTQNKRNRMINRRYTSTIKTLSKLLTKKIKTFNQESNANEELALKKENEILVQGLYSILDKAVKKGVLHKNNAARKKSRFGKLLAKI